MSVQVGLAYKMQKLSPDTEFHPAGKQNEEKIRKFKGMESIPTPC